MLQIDEFVQIGFRKFFWFRQVNRLFKYFASRKLKKQASFLRKNIPF